MNTKHLTYFVEIARQKNMNKAAESLYVSQSSLSQYLTRLEAELGHSLFYRLKGNLTLTPAGVLYLNSARKILQLEQELIRNLDSLSTPGYIRVGVNSIWSNALVTSITTQFHIKYPDITIKVFEDNHKIIKKLVDDGEIDIAILATDTLDALQEFGEILRYEEIVFAVSNENLYIRQQPSPPKELNILELVREFQDESFILPKSNSSFRPMLDQSFDSCNFRPNVVCEISNMNTVRNMVSHNIGVAFIPISCCSDEFNITYFSIVPKLSRINAMIHRSTLAFHEEEKHFMSLVKTYPLDAPKP